MNNSYKLMHVENYNRGENENKKDDKKNKFCFSDYKKNTLHSLNEIEYFLNNLDKAFKCAKFYKFIKF